MEGSYRTFRANRSPHQSFMELFSKVLPKHYKPMMHYKPTPPFSSNFLYMVFKKVDVLYAHPRLTNRANNNVHEKESSSHLGLHAMHHALPTCTFQPSQSLVRLPRFSFALRQILRSEHVYALAWERHTIWKQRQNKHFDFQQVHRH